jgi:hypothetical protein
LLTKQDPTDLVALAEHADELWSHQQQDGIIAAVDALVVEDGTVAAVNRGGVRPAASGPPTRRLPAVTRSRSRRSLRFPGRLG